MIPTLHCRSRCKSRRSVSAAIFTVDHAHLFKNIIDLKLLSSKVADPFPAAERARFPMCCFLPSHLTPLSWRSYEGRMKLEVLTIEHDAQRYVTLGDYWEDDDGLHIRISRLGDWRYEALVLIHELVELLLVRAAGIEIAAVDAWDTQHLDLEEPGAHPDAPYHRQHAFAEGVERCVALALGVVWADYEARITASLSSPSRIP